LYALDKLVIDTFEFEQLVHVLDETYETFVGELLSVCIYLGAYTCYSVACFFT